MSPPVSSYSTTPPRAIGEPRPDSEVLNLVDGLRAGIRENGWRSAGAGASRLVSRGWPIRCVGAAWPVSDWFLPEGERALGLRETSCTPHVHRADHFAPHLEVVEAARAGDRIFFTDWRGDSDERLTDAGPTIGELLCEQARRGVHVRGLFRLRRKRVLQMFDRARPGAADPVEVTNEEFCLGTSACSHTLTAPSESTAPNL